MTVSGLLLVLVSGLGSLTYGYASNVIGTTLAQPSFLHEFGLDTRSNATALITCITALFQVGGLIGVLSLSYLADRFGRKGLLAIASVLAVVTFALQAGAKGIGMFITFRTLSGVAIGQFLSGVPLYIGEAAPPKIRGTLVAFHGVSLAVGFTLAGWANEGFYKMDTAWAFRLPLAIQGVFPLALLGALFFLPESPRWKVMHGMNEDAQRIMQQLHGGSSEEATAFAESEFQLLVAQDELDRKYPVTWSMLFSKPSYRKRALIGWITCFANPASGTLIINNYFPTLLNGLGISPNQQILVSAGYTTLTLVGNALSMFLIDRIGRRKMFLIGNMGCVIWLIAEMICVAQGINTQAGRGAGVAILFCQLLWFATMIDAVTYAYASEIWPNRMRAKGFAFSMTGFFSASSLFIGISYTAFENINYWFYVPFIVVTSLIWVFQFCVYPELSGVPQEQVAAKFGDEIADLAILEGPEFSEKSQNGHIA